MDWKVFLLLLLVLHICYGQNNTCKTNPTDNSCYCVLNSNSTDNWHEAVSFCADVKGILVDISSQDTNDFVLSLMTEASVIDAWVGIKGNSSSAVLVSDPSTAISYPTKWTVPLDNIKMCASITNGGNWEGVECSGSANQKSTICRMPAIDSSGYNINTGCPFNSFLFGSKCYQIFTWTTGKMFQDTLNAANNVDFCKAKNATGKLILPLSEAENQFIVKVGKLSGLDKFWIRVEYGSTIPHYYDYVTSPSAYITYGRDQLTPASGDNEKYFISMSDGSWGKQYVFYPEGVMCEFDKGTPGAALPFAFQCPVPINAQKNSTTTTPTASGETTVSQGVCIVKCIVTL